MSKAAFVLASTMGSAMIVNRFDYDPASPEHGVGIELLNNGQRDLGLTMIVCKLALQRRQTRGDGVVLIDGGANIGSYAVHWARFMAGWGEVIAFEPQRWPFYALCGNLALNNCFNARAFMLALAERTGNVEVPYWAPDEPCNFGGMALTSDAAVKYVIPSLALDDKMFERLDILKLDIEGMEPQAIRGAFDTIHRCKPIIIAEAHICGAQAIIDLLPDYAMIGLGVDLLCLHKDENPALHKEIEQLATHLGAKQVR